MNVMSVCHYRVGVVTGRSEGKEAKGTFPDKSGSRETDPRPGWRSQANMCGAPSKLTIRFFMLIRPLFWAMMLCDGVIDSRLSGAAFILKGQYILKE
jgi:hypothetical protein